MKTPLYNYLNKVIKKGTVRFFMPGHKGAFPQDNPLQQIAKYDITEISGADALFEADGVIAQSEDIASDYFGSKATLFTTAGSTSSIQTMLKLVANKENAKIIAVRNAHMSFINTCTLLRINPVWILPRLTDTYGVRGGVYPDSIEDELIKNPDACAVYITSPDYLGNVSDVRAIADICKKYNVPLLCDNAHGAYLKTTGMHPLDLGASMCCDSAHKTLPALTGAGYLHLSHDCKYSKKEAKYAMSMFASTSPSYLTLLSLDLCNEYLYSQAKNDFLTLKEEILKLKQNLEYKGIKLLNNEVDFAKITVDANSMGYTGIELQKYLTEHHLECEYANENYIVFMISPFNTKKDLDRFEDLISRPIKKPAIKSRFTPYKLPKRRFLPYEIDYMENEIIDIDESEGRISAENMAKCPPGVPIIVRGEEINEQIKKILKNCGNVSVKVVL